MESHIRKTITLLSRPDDENIRGVIEQNRHVERYAEKNKLPIARKFETEISPSGFTECINEILCFIEKNPNENYDIISYHPIDWRALSDFERFNTLAESGRINSIFLHHECFNSPTSDAKVWRYISLPKFIDLIQSHTLFFCRADLLRLSDGYEGQYSTTYLTRELDKLIAARANFPSPEFDPRLDSFIEFDKAMNELNENKFLRSSYINCWHLASHESIAMWKIYADPFGVCVQTRYQQLCDSFIDDKWSSYSNLDRIYIGIVNYIDRTTMGMPRGNMFWPYMHKSIGYAFENELRCFIFDRNSMNNSNSATYIRTKIDIATLIENIYLHPEAPNWYYDTIVELCSRYEINSLQIHKSNLA